MKGKTETFTKAPSAAEAAKDAPKPKQVNPHGYDTPCTSERTTLPDHYVNEHQMIPSRLGGKAREVSFGPLPAGLVPSNPFSSLQQAKFAHVHPEKFGGKAGLKEWDSTTNFKKIPKRVTQ